MIVKVLLSTGKQEIIPVIPELIKCSPKEYARDIVEKVLYDLDDFTTTILEIVV